MKRPTIRSASERLYQLAIECQAGGDWVIPVWRSTDRWLIVSFIGGGAEVTWRWEHSPSGQGFGHIEAKARERRLETTRRSLGWTGRSGEAWWLGCHMREVVESLKGVPLRSGPIDSSENVYWLAPGGEPGYYWWLRGPERGLGLEVRFRPDAVRWAVTYSWSSGCLVRTGTWGPSWLKWEGADD